MRSLRSAVVYFIPFYTLFIAVIDCVAIDNGITAFPEIVCDSDSLTLKATTRNPFTGRMYVKGESLNTDCTVNYTTNATMDISITVPLMACNVRRVRIPGGAFEYTTTVVVSFHRTFETKVDRAYRVHCLFSQLNNTFTAPSIEVSMIPTTETLSQTAGTAQCTYDIRRGSVDGPVLRYATIGESVFHVWKCETAGMRILVKDCYVDDGGGNKVATIDSKGCTIDRYVIQTPTYVGPDYIMVYTEAHVFKYADRPTVLFECQIQFCDANDMSCQDTSPPTCEGTPAPTSSGNFTGLPTVSPSGTGHTGSTNASSTFGNYTGVSTFGPTTGNYTAAFTVSPTGNYTITSRSASENYTGLSSSTSGNYTGLTASSGPENYTSGPIFDNYTSSNPVPGVNHTAITEPPEQNITNYTPSTEENYTGVIDQNVTTLFPANFTVSPLNTTNETSPFGTTLSSVVNVTSLAPSPLYPGFPSGLINETSMNSTISVTSETSSSTTTSSATSVNTNSLSLENATLPFPTPGPMILATTGNRSVHNKKHSRRYQRSVQDDGTVENGVWNVVSNELTVMDLEQEPTTNDGHNFDSQMISDKEEVDQEPLSLMTDRKYSSTRCIPAYDIALSISAVSTLLIAVTVGVALYCHSTRTRKDSRP